LLCLQIGSVVGLNDEAGRFGVFLGIVFLVNIIGISLGLAVSSASSSVETAGALGVPVNILGILFGGFYINVNALPIVANWLPYFSLFRWALQSFATNEFKGLTFKCDAPDPSQCMFTGEEVLDYLDFGGHSIGYPVFGLFMLLLGWVVAGYCILAYNKRRYLAMGHRGKKHFRLEEQMNPAAVSAVFGGDAPQAEDAKKGKEYELVSVDPTSGDKSS
jgi:hypothetical protein